MLLLLCSLVVLNLFVEVLEGIVVCLWVLECSWILIFIVGLLCELRICCVCIVLIWFIGWVGYLVDSCVFV